MKPPIESTAGPMIRIALAADRIQLAGMRASLWPEASFEDHLRELESAPVGTLPSETFVAISEGSGLVGFLDVGLRSHADGCNPARPVGFVEGWFVQKAFRNLGIGGALMRAAEKWAREQGALRWLPTAGSITRNRSERMWPSGSR